MIVVAHQHIRVLGVDELPSSPFRGPSAVHLAVTDGDASPRARVNFSRSGDGFGWSRTRLCRKYTCPPRFTSRWMACTDDAFVVVPADDARLDRQAVLRRCFQRAEVTRMPVERRGTACAGMGVALMREHVHGRVRRSLNCSLCFDAEASAPRPRSTRPRSLNCTSGDTSAVRADELCPPCPRPRRPASGPPAAASALRKRLRTAPRVTGYSVDAARGNCAKVLLGEHRGRHQQRDLLAAHRSALNAARIGHLGLAEADVAAQQAVHWPGLLEVALDHGLDRASPGRASPRTRTPSSNSRCQSLSGGNS